MKILNTKEMGVKSPIKCIVYGESGAGKTTLAGTLNENTLVISAEAGLRSLADKNIDVIDITLDDNGVLIPKEKRITRLGEVYKYLLTNEAQKKYSTIFIDSLSELNQNLLEQLQVEYTDAKDTLRMYGEMAKRMRSLIKSFRDLPHYNVVMSALSEVDKDENGVRVIGIQIVGKMSQQIAAFFDEIFYLHVDKDEQGSAKRILVTEKSDRLVAKDRSGRLDKFEAPHLGDIFDKIRGIKKEIKNA